MPKKILFTDMDGTLLNSQKQISPQIEEIVKEEDPYAFMIVTSASEIYGEGYKDFFGEVM